MFIFLLLKVCLFLHYPQGTCLSFSFLNLHCCLSSSPPPPPPSSFSYKCSDRNSGGYELLPFQGNALRNVKERTKHVRQACLTLQTICVCLQSAILFLTTDTPFECSEPPPGKKHPPCVYNGPVLGSRQHRYPHPATATTTPTPQPNVHYISHTNWPILVK